MKRLCIYLAYDRQKCIDRYVGYMLKELRTCVNKLVVVYNGMEIIRGRDILEKNADQIFYRENKGFDVGGFKDALCKFLGWDKVLEFDELVLVNDSFFGPFEKMGNIFSQMDKRKIDFWGLIKFGETVNEDEYIPEHIQTFFYVIRSKMLHGIEFKKYWEQMPYYNRFDDVVKYHEIKFTKYFLGLGYSYDSLADTQVNDSKKICNNYLQYGTICYELIKDRNFPFLKKQQISYKQETLQTQENLRQALEYIDKNTEYDVDLIWENIIRTMNVSDLQNNLHLEFIIGGERKKCMDSPLAAICIIAKYKGIQEYLANYIHDINDVCDIYIVSSDRYILEEYECAGYRNCIFVSGQCDYNKMEFLCAYEYVCMIQDTDISSDIKPSCTGKSYFYSILENLVKDKRQIQGIIEQFKKNERLGFLAPPRPYFAHYFGKIGTGWDGMYETVVDFSKKLNLNCELSYDKPPFTVSDSFWIRGDIFRKLFSNVHFEMGCLQCLSYMWIYIVQDAGYYSGIVESDDYAGMNEVNLTMYLETVASDIRRYFGEFQSFADFRKVIARKALEDFCKQYTNIYIYGIGYIAKQYCELIAPIADAFIVSDGQEKRKAPLDLPVFYLSEIDSSENIGIIICLNERNQYQVIPLLKQMGLNNYLCI